MSGIQGPTPDTHTSRPQQTLDGTLPPNTKEGTKKVLAFTMATGIGTRRWFTRTDDNDDPLPGTQEQENRNLDMGLGRLTHAGSEPGRDSEDEDGSLMDPVEDFERREEARGVECFQELYEVQ